MILHWPIWVNATNNVIFFKEYLLITNILDAWNHLCKFMMEMLLSDYGKNIYISPMRSADRSKHTKTASTEIYRTYINWLLGLVTNNNYWLLKFATIITLCMHISLISLYVLIQMYSKRQYKILYVDFIWRYW